MSSHIKNGQFQPSLVFKTPEEYIRYLEDRLDAECENYKNLKFAYEQVCNILYRWKEEECEIDLNLTKEDRESIQKELSKLFDKVKKEIIDNPEKFEEEIKKIGFRIRNWKVK